LNRPQQAGIIVDAENYAPRSTTIATDTDTATATTTTTTTSGGAGGGSITAGCLACDKAFVAKTEIDLSQQFRGRELVQRPEA
jgi:hypothetical protein